MPEIKHGKFYYMVIQKIDGESFTSVLEDAGYQGIRPLYWHYPNQWGPEGPGIGAASAIRKGDWKFIYFHSDRRMELYNLQEDIGETTNLLDQNKDKAIELAKNLSDHLKAVDAQMPIDKSTGEVVAYPSVLLSKE